MIEIVKLLLVYFFAILLLSFLLKSLRRTESRWGFILVHGVFLTFITIGCSNNFPLFLSEQASGLSLVEVLRPQGSAKAFDEFMANNNLLLVDVSQDLQTLPDPFADPAHNAKRLTTDRNKLTAFLNKFISDTVLNQKTDLIVCDILLDGPDSSHIDAALSRSINQLSAQGKFLLAESVDQNLASCNENANLDLRKVNTGLVNIDLHDGLFFNYTLMPVAGKHSLAYKMYSQLNHVQADVARFTGFGSWLIEEFDAEDRSSGRKWPLNTFIPDLFLREDDLGNGKDASRESVSRTTREPGWLSFGNLRQEKRGFFKENNKLQFEKLGLLVNENLLEFINPTKASTLVFIGTFADGQRDMHQTAFGNMHGSLLQLNVFFNLLRESNIVTPGFLIFLWVMFSLLTWAMLRGKVEPANDHISDIAAGLKAEITRLFEPVRRFGAKLDFDLNETIQADHLSESNKGIRTIMVKIKIYLYVIIRTALRRVRMLFQVVAIDQLPYWVLFSILCIASLYFNHIVNIMGLTIYTAAVDLSIKVLASER